MPCRLDQNILHKYLETSPDASHLTSSSHHHNVGNFSRSNHSIDLSFTQSEFSKWSCIFKSKKWAKREENSRDKEYGFGYYKQSMSLGNTSRSAWCFQKQSQLPQQEPLSPPEGRWHWHWQPVLGISLLDAVRFWCNLAWVGHISQAYLDYIGWLRNITRQMIVWRNSKRTQLNKENLSLVAYLLFVVRSASFRLQMLVFLYQIKAQRAVWVQILNLQK